MRALIFAAVLSMACAGVQLPKEKLGGDPGALMFNGYTKADVACFSCHGGDGKGSMRGPGLADEVEEHSDEQLRDVIKEGDGRMPAHKDRMSDDEIAQVLAWLRVSFPTPLKPAAPAPAVTN